MSVSARWDLDLVAASSITHGGQTQATTTLFRRELLPVPDGGFDHLPVISGNAVRSCLRRLAGQLFVDALNIEGQLPAPVAALLVNGGALAKTSTPSLTGARRAQARTWLPPLGLFGGAATGVLIDGCVRTSKLIPICAETAPVTGINSHQSIYDLLQLEDYTHTANPDDDTLDTAVTTGQMRYSIEVLATGTHLHGTITTDRATSLQHHLLDETITTWTHHGTIGGRQGSGHGQLTGTATCTILRGTLEPLDWRTHLTNHHDQITATIQALA